MYFYVQELVSAISSSLCVRLDLEESCKLLLKLFLYVILTRKLVLDEVDGLPVLNIRVAAVKLLIEGDAAIAGDTYSNDLLGMTTYIVIN